MRIEIAVLARDGVPVADASVKAYSREWPIRYPREGFERTDERGQCAIRLPRGLWTVVVGGGQQFLRPDSGRGLLLAQDVSLENDQTITVRPSSPEARISFVDRSGKPADLDQVFAAPSRLVPVSLMPDIGRTSEGACIVDTNLREPVSFFLVRRPLPTREGYFLSYPQVRLTTRADFRAGRPPLTRLHFDGHAPDGRPGPIEWKLCFPYQDLARSLGHTGFVIVGEADAYVNVGFLNCMHYVKIGNGTQWTYVSHLRGLSLSGVPMLSLRAGGALRHELRILPIGARRTQFWLGPVQDAYRNIVQCYSGASGAVQVPLRVWDEPGGKLLHSGVFEISSDNLGFQIEEGFPKTAVFELEWDLGPWGGKHTLSGSLRDPAYQYRYTDTETAHFTIHTPAEFPDKVDLLAVRLEAAYAAMTAVMSTNPPPTKEKNFYVHPAGLWASANGQELFLHGFLWWHPTDPASLGWEGGSFHEIGHRMESELFGAGSRHCTLRGMQNEVVASLLAQLAIATIHGPQFANPHREGEAHRFFDRIQNLSEGKEASNEGLYFVMQDYVPRRFGEGVTRRFFRVWPTVCPELQDRGYQQEEILVALYSALCKSDLSWLFRLSGMNIEELRVREAREHVERLISLDSGK